MLSQACPATTYARHWSFHPTQNSILMSPRLLCAPKPCPSTPQPKSHAHTSLRAAKQYVPHSFASSCSVLSCPRLFGAWPGGSTPTPACCVFQSTCAFLTVSILTASPPMHPHQNRHPRRLTPSPCYLLRSLHCPPVPGPLCHAAQQQQRNNTKPSLPAPQPAAAQRLCHPIERQCGAATLRSLPRRPWTWPSLLKTARAMPERSELFFW